MKFRISYLFLAITLFSLVMTGFDFTHHAHNSWLYYQMIKNWDFTGVDPYFTSQITYAYGVIAYFFSGLLWFIFGIHSITIIQIICILVSYYILTKLFKQDRWVSLLIVLNMFFTIFDSYPSHFSNCLFWVATYGFYKNKKWWLIPLLLAAFNHPFVLIASLFFTVKQPWLIIPQSLILSYFLIATSIFTNDLFLPVYTIFMGFVRMFLCLLPILLLSKEDKINIKNFKILRDISKINASLPTIISLMVLEGGLIVALAVFVLVMQPTNVVDFTMFEGIPAVNGTLKVVDYLYLPSVFVLPFEGYTLYDGSFRENNPQHLVQTLWSSISEYDNFLNENNISYVLFCTMCNPQSNEKEMLEGNYPLVWSNDYYTMYSVN